MYHVVDDWTEFPGEHAVNFRERVMKQSRYVLVVYTESIANDVIDDVLHHHAFKEKVKSSSFIPITIDGSKASLQTVATMTEPIVFQRDFENDHRRWQVALKLLANPEKLKAVCVRGQLIETSPTTQEINSTVDKRQKQGMLN